MCILSENAQHLFVWLVTFSCQAGQVFLIVLQISLHLGIQEDHAGSGFVWGFCVLFCFLGVFWCFCLFWEVYYLFVCGVLFLLFLLLFCFGGCFCFGLFIFVPGKNFQGEKEDKCAIWDWQERKTYSFLRLPIILSWVSEHWKAEGWKICMWS